MPRRRTIDKFKSAMLSSGGLIRSMGELFAAVDSRAKRDKETVDKRVLGRGDFVEVVLREAEDQLQVEGSLGEAMD